MARFRQTHETERAQLVTQMLQLGMEAGLGKVGVVARDGTTIQAGVELNGRDDHGGGLADAD